MSVIWGVIFTADLIRLASSSKPFWTCQKLCASSADCMRNPVTSCVPIEHNLGACSNLFFVNSAAEVCFGSSCPKEGLVFCNVTSGEVLPFPPGEDNQPTDCKCRSFGTNRLCVDNAPNICQQVCDETKGCHSSFCMTWEKDPKCFGLYWGTRSKACFEDPKCPKDNPVLCSGVKTTIVSTTDPAIRDATPKKTKPVAASIEDSTEPEDLVLNGFTMCGKALLVASVSLKFKEKTADLFINFKTVISLPDQQYSVTGSTLTFRTTEALKLKGKDLNQIVPDTLTFLVGPEGFDFELGSFKIPLKRSACTPSFYRDSGLPSN